MSEAPFTVRELEQAGAGRWDEFVNRHPHGTPFHLTAWKRAIEETFPYRPRYLLAECDGRIRGVLPLFLVENPIIGRVLLSSPFAVYGGILADSTAARDALRDRVSELGRSLGVGHVELRNAREEQCVGFERIHRYVTFTLPVADRTEEEWLRSLPRKTRNMVRKTMRFGYSSRFATGLGHFYDLLARTYRRLGTPVFPLRFYEALLRHYGDVADVREVMLEREVVAASFNFRYRDELHTYYAASSDRHFSKSPNNFMYFDLLRWAGAHGFTSFDFGRSKRETGNFEFKKHWGGAIRELPYEILLVRRERMPDFTPKNPKFQPAIKAWRRLPLPVTRLLGPHLIKWFP